MLVGLGPGPNNIKLFFGFPDIFVIFQDTIGSGRSWKTFQKIADKFSEPNISGNPTNL